jgi:hypothetical protein
MTALDDIEAIKRTLRWEPTERLRETLRRGDADQAMIALIHTELASRLSLVPRPEDSSAEPTSSTTDGPPPLPDDIPHGDDDVSSNDSSNDTTDVGPLSYESMEIEPSQSRPWLWLAVFVVALVFCGSFGVTPSNRNDTGFLHGVIFVQAGLLTGILAVMGSFVRSSSGWGVLGRLLMLLIVLALTGAVSFCAFFIRHGWGG